jgi:histidine triad (HIT) family protein
MPCLFCQIAAREVPATILHEDDQVMAFLDICPIRPGHAQIIPKEHHTYFDDLPSPVALRILELGQKLSRTMKQLYQVERVAFLFTGGDVAHAHAHVVPMQEGTDITSRQYIAEEKLTFRSTPRVPQEELERVATILKGSLNLNFP